MTEKIETILENLTGQEAPFKPDIKQKVDMLVKASGIGYSQLNELLLMLGYDRVSPAFFQFLLDGNASAKKNNAFLSLDELQIGIDRFRERAILRFGNVKYGFKYLSAIDEEKLHDELSLFDKIDESVFAARHDPLVPIVPIDGDKTYYLGYLIKRKLDERIIKNPKDAEARNELVIRDKIVKMGKKNHEAYLVSDHMDVYVATSMRERHEYQIVRSVVSEIFSDPRLQKMKIRWFDPTQAYCEERIDKGLAEGLMLKRADCTLYLAQESDTLGKDSELASTLAQGKTVIAYIPAVTVDEQDVYVERLLAMIKEGSPELTDNQTVLQQLRIFYPGAAWFDKEVMSWLSDESKMDLSLAKRKLGDCIREHYDKRATTLKESHPLGIQVHLETGVANGVIVARSTSQCAELIRRVLTNTLKFSIKEENIEGNRYLFIIENITQSVFRVVSGDSFLTNAFWNFYLTK